MASAIELPYQSPLLSDNSATLDDSKDGMEYISTVTVAQKRNSTISQRRVSVASTTKSELRHNNQVLMEMLQNVQSELSAHRTIMLNIQQRVSHLEHSDHHGSNDDGNHQQRRLSNRNSHPIVTDPQWWQTCQSYAHAHAHENGTVFDVSDFVKPSKRHSGLSWQQPHEQPSSPPETPSDMDDVPPLLMDAYDEVSRTLLPPGKYSFVNAREIMEPMTPGYSTDNDSDSDNDDDEDYIRIRPAPYHSDIRESMVEVDKSRYPSPPLIQSPPAGKPRSVRSQEALESIRARDAVEGYLSGLIEAEPVVKSQRIYRGVKSLMTYKALMRNQKTEQQHRVLIHFHRRADLRSQEE